MIRETRRNRVNVVCPQNRCGSRAYAVSRPSLAGPWLTITVEGRTGGFFWLLPDPRFA